MNTSELKNLTKEQLDEIRDFASYITSFLDRLEQGEISITDLAPFAQTWHEAFLKNPDDMVLSLKHAIVIRSIFPIFLRYMLEVSRLNDMVEEKLKDMEPGTTYFDAVAEMDLDDIKRQDTETETSFISRFINKGNNTRH